MKTKHLFLIVLLCISGLTAAEAPSSGIRGYILDNTGNPLIGANVIIKETLKGVATDKNGYFSIRHDAGNYTLDISFIGYKRISTKISLQPERLLDKKYTMQLEYFEIGGIVVQAHQDLIPDEAETKTRVSSGEIEHLQASNLSDVMQLTPGVRFENPGMSEKKQIGIRSSSTGGDADDNDYFGAQVVLDNIPVSNNANLQLDTKTTTSSGDLLTTENSGIDMRQIPADNIEEVEIIRGIPSSKYGDLTSGIIHVKTKSNVTHHRVKFKYNFYNQEVNMNGGFKLDPEGNHHLDYNMNYAYSVRDKRIPEENYSRVAAQIGFNSKLMNQLLTLKNRFYFTRAFDERELREDDLNLTEKYNRDKTYRFTHESQYLLSTTQKVEMNASINYTKQNSYTKRLVSSDNTYVTGLMEEGTDTGMYVQNYISELYVLGEAYNLYLNIDYDGVFDVGKSSHHFLTGITLRDEFNNGEGRVFDPLKPPSLGGGLRTRPRSYDDIPSLVTSSFYAEDKIKGTLIKPFKLNLGLRLESYGKDKLLSGDHGTYLNPRINFIYYPTETTQIRMGYGETSKSPSLGMLYPNPIYMDVDDVNNIVDSTIIVSTYIYSKENPDLKASRQVKQEISIDQKLGDMGLTVTAYKNMTYDGFASTGRHAIFEYKYDYTVSETDPPITDSVFTSYTSYENSLTKETRGIEASIQTKAITPLKLRFKVDASYNYTYSWKDNSYDYEGFRYDPDLDSYVNPFFSPLTIEREKLYINYKMEFKIKELGAWVTLAAQQVVFDKDRYIGLEDSMALGYTDIYGDQHLFTEEERLAITSASYKRVEPYYMYYEENRKNIWVFNLRASKSLGKSSEFSFFVNNIFNSRPLYQRLRTPSLTSYTMENPALYFGIEVSSKLDELKFFSK